MIIQKWCELLTDLQKQKVLVDQKGRFMLGKYEQLIKNIAYDELEQPLDTIKKLGWVYPKREELKSILTEEKQCYAYNYSQPIREQLPVISELLMECPNTRQAIIILTQKLVRQKQDLPCLISAQYWVKEEDLNMLLFVRSMDCLFGFPANLYHAKLLLSMMIERTGYKPGYVSLIIGNLHIFTSYKDEINKLLKLVNNKNNMIKAR